MKSSDTPSALTNEIYATASASLGVVWVSNVVGNAGFFAIENVTAAPTTSTPEH